MSVMLHKENFEQFMNMVSACYKKPYWESTTGFKQVKGLISGPSAKRTKDLLKLNRDQLRWVVGLLTGLCHLRSSK
jgi:hypothetical protein